MVAEILIRSLGAFFAVISFGLLLELPQKYLMHAGCVGGCGWLVYLVVEFCAFSEPLAAFLSSLVVACMSHIFARKLKAPVMVFLVAGILPSVPGASIYRSVYYMIRDLSSLSNHYLVQTLQIAGAIAMAVFFIDSLFRLGQDRGKRS
ncbi:MAG: threonine/serine exporter family protein [Lachnospiraceae bacterium]|nr:threonine/serine exporter family protein [Lachnospiraceae bacterium]